MVNQFSLAIKHQMKINMLNDEKNTKAIPVKELWVLEVNSTKAVRANSSMDNLEQPSQ
jgi:hypothetical protein